MELEVLDFLISAYHPILYLPVGKSVAIAETLFNQVLPVVLLSLRLFAVANLDPNTD